MVQDRPSIPTYTSRKVAGLPRKRPSVAQDASGWIILVVRTARRPQIYGDVVSAEVILG